MDKHAILDRFFPAMFGKDWETLSELLTEDIAWNVPPSIADQFGELRGRQAVIDFLSSASGDFFEPGSFVLEPHMRVAEEDNAVWIARIRGRTAKGRPYQNEYAFSFRFREGHIHEVRELLDTAHFQSHFR